MGIEYKDAISEQLPDSDTLLYTCPTTASSAHIITAVVACEDASASTISVNLVKSGDTPDATNLYIQTKTVGAGATEVLTQLAGIVLKGGDAIYCAAADAERLNVKIAIREVS